jgi:tetratricopeptide (TPR) repeat protein
MTLTMKNSLLAIVTVAAMAFAAPVLAAGSDSDSTKNQCPEGKVYDEASKSCVDQQGQLNDTQIYEVARQMAYAGKYDDALKTLARARNQSDPRILTYYGFTNRKLGNTEVAMDFYQRAIAADANNLLARSYMGQGMVQEGNLEGARMQLVEIRDRGGKDSYAYKALYEALKHGSTY